MGSNRNGKENMIIGWREKISNVICFEDTAI